MCFYYEIFNLFNSVLYRSPNDIALVKLERPVELNDGVNFVCLPLGKDTFYRTHNGTKTGLNYCLILFKARIF